MVRVVPPPVGAFAEWPGAGWDLGWGSGRWACQRSRVQTRTGVIGDGQLIGGPGDGDDATMVQPMVIRAQQHQVGKVGGAAVFPVPNVMSMQTTGGATARNRTAGIAVLECATQPPIDGAGHPARTDDPAVASEPHFTGGITGQVPAIGVAEQRTQM